MHDQEMVLPDGSKLLLIHYVAPRAVDGALRLACAPNMVELHAYEHRQWPYRRTGETGPVTCPLCKETPAYQEAVARQRDGLARRRYLS
jgi:hypothetical protein